MLLFVFWIEEKLLFVVVIKLFVILDIFFNFSFIEAERELLYPLIILKSFVFIILSFFSISFNLFIFGLKIPLYLFLFNFCLLFILVFIIELLFVWEIKFPFVFNK